LRRGGDREEREQGETKNGRTSRRQEGAWRGPSASKTLSPLLHPFLRLTSFPVLKASALHLLFLFLHRRIFLWLVLTSPCPPLFCTDDGDTLSHSPSTLLIIVQSGPPPPGKISPPSLSVMIAMEFVRKD